MHMAKENQLPWEIGREELIIAPTSQTWKLRPVWITAAGPGLPTLEGALPSQPLMHEEHSVLLQLPGVQGSRGQAGWRTQASLLGPSQNRLQNTIEV